MSKPQKSLNFTLLSLGQLPLTQLLTRHDDARHSGFISHLDRSPLSHKRNAFRRGLIMNACLLLIIAWLISATILRDAFTPLETPVLIAFYVTQDLIIAWALYSILATTTIPFLFGECRLRMRCGFRPTEVVFRRPPMLDKGLSQAECVEQYRRFVARSMDPYLIYASVSSFMTNELWVSAYPAIIDAYDLIDRGEVNEGSLESAIWLQKDGTWSVCELCKIENMV